MGFGVRIAPGLRISASSRGIRAGIGPRAARIHVGSGRTGFSTGAGPLTYYTSAGRRRTRAARPRAISQGTYEREMRRAERVQLISRVAELETELVEAHLQAFPRAVEPEVPAVSAVLPSAYLKDAKAAELSGISVFASLTGVRRRSARG